MLNISTSSHVAPQPQFLNAKQKLKCHVSFSDELGFMSGPDFENRCRLDQTIRGRMQLAIKQNYVANMQPPQPLLTLHSLLLLSNLCFHLSCDVSPTAQTAKNSGSLEHLALMEKGFCGLKRERAEVGTRFGLLSVKRGHIKQ